MIPTKCQTVFYLIDLFLYLVIFRKYFKGFEMNGQIKCLQRLSLEITQSFDMQLIDIWLRILTPMANRIAAIDQINRLLGV